MLDLSSKNKEVFPLSSQMYLQHKIILKELTEVKDEEVWNGIQ